MMIGRKRGRPPQGVRRPLSRERIVKAALRIVDGHGLEALSMRRLGAVLGVDPMTVYYYVPNKAALYDAIVEAVMREIDVPLSDEKAPLLERLKGMARAYRDALLAHPNTLPVIAARPIRTASSLKPIERMLGLLLDFGLPVRMAMAAVNDCGHYILGCVQSYVPHLADAPMHEHDQFDESSLSPEEFPNLHKVLAVLGGDYPFETEFEIGLDALMRGFLSAYGPEAPPSRS